MSLTRVMLAPVVVAVAVFASPRPSLAAQKSSAAGQRIYDRECATCHGPEGKGDGETATYLSPQPQDFTTGIVQKRSDEFLTTVISKGGVAKGLSESMPAFPKLSKSELQGVVAYVRELAKGAPGKKPQ